MSAERKEWEAVQSFTGIKHKASGSRAMANPLFTAFDRKVEAVSRRKLACTRGQCNVMS